jgi:23S rRNA pseudouridine1911/1915/1917 synthase
VIHHREDVPDALDGQRLDRVVAMVSGHTRASVAELLAAGAVRVDGQPSAKGSVKLRVGQVVEIDAPDDTAPVGPVADPSIDLVVVHADEDVVVVDKPPGLVVHPGAGNDSGTLVHGLLARYPELAGVGDLDRPGIVHRLDKGTSGLLVVARTPVAYTSLVAQLSERRVERRYLALVWGHLDATQGLIDAPIGRAKREPTRMAVSAKGREARTRYEVQRAFSDPADVSLLTCRLETGRTHQIRVHLDAIGHPVVGDGRYGGARRSLDCARPFLHAAHLAFDHPVSGERLAFDAPLPDDLERVLAGLS